MHLQVRSESVTGIPVREISMIAEGQVVVSRILHEGSMTDPPALAFAGAFTGSDAPSIAYATVYPLTMLLRLLLAQLALLLFMR